MLRRNAVAAVSVVHNRWIVSSWLESFQVDAARTILERRALRRRVGGRVGVGVFVVDMVGITAVIVLRIRIIVIGVALRGHHASSSLLSSSETTVHYRPISMPVDSSQPSHVAGGRTSCLEIGDTLFYLFLAIDVGESKQEGEHRPRSSWFLRDAFKMPCDLKRRR